MNTDSEIFTYLDIHIMKQFKDLFDSQDLYISLHLVEVN